MVMHGSAHNKKCHPGKERNGEEEVGQEPRDRSAKDESKADHLASEKKIFENDRGRPADWPRHRSSALEPQRKGRYPPEEQETGDAKEEEGEPSETKNPQKCPDSAGQRGRGGKIGHQ